MASPRQLGVSKLRFCTSRIVFLSLFCLVASWSDEAQGTTMSLEEAVASALQASPEARIARLQTEQAEDELAVARSRFWPHASISSQAGYSNRLDEELEVVDGTGRVRRYGLSSLASDRGWLNVELEQLVFDLAQWRTLERTELETEAARISADERRESISFEILERYARVLKTDRLLEIERRRVRDTEWLDGQAELLLQAGRCLPSERAQVSLALDEARLEEVVLGEEATDGRQALLRAVGKPADGGGKNLELVPESLPSPVRIPTRVLEKDLLEAAPELRVLQLRRRMHEVEISAARAGAYPTVGLGAAYRNYGVNRFDNYEDEVSIGVDFRLPLFDGFRTRSSVASALKGAEIARLRYEAMYEDKRVRVSDLRRKLETAQGRPALARRRVHLAEEQLRIADLNLRAGRGSIGAALEAREQWQAASVGAVQAEHERILLWAELQRETGRLAARLLGEGRKDAEGNKP